MGRPGSWPSWSRRLRAGHSCSAGAGADQERDLPFWVFVDALDEYVGASSRDGSNLDDEVRAELAQVFPSLPTSAAGPVALQVERYRIHRAVRELLERLAATRPLVLVLDDFHWADDASAELVAACCSARLRRRADGARRAPQPVPSRLAAALDRAHRDGVLTGIELEPLTRGEALELIGHSHRGSRAAALYEERRQSVLPRAARPLSGSAHPGSARGGRCVPRWSTGAADGR